MVSFNFWDIAGARSAGIQTCCWINREEQAWKTKEELADKKIIIKIIKNLIILMPQEKN